MVWVHLYLDFFQEIHATVLHEPQSVESIDVEPQVWTSDCKIMCGFLCV